jgi:hypothetical protein
MIVCGLLIAWFGGGPSTAQGQSLPSALVAFHDYSGQGAHHVIYQAQDQGLYDLNYQQSVGHWQLSQVAPWGPTMSQLTGYSDGTNNHVFGISPIGSQPHVVEYYGSPVPNQRNDLTIASGTQETPHGSVTYCGPYQNIQCVSSPSSLTGFWDGTVEHVFYETWDTYTIHELYHYNNRWWDNPLPGVPAMATNGAGLTSLWDGSIEHVYYTGQDADLHELYFSGRWWDNDWNKVKWGKVGIVNYNSALAASYDGQTSTQGVFGVAWPQTGDLLRFTYGPSGFSGGYVALTNFNAASKILTYDVSSTQCLNQAQPPCSTTSQRQLFYVGSDHYLYEVTGSTAHLISPSFNPYQCSYTNPNGNPPPGYFVNANSPISGFYDGTYRHIFFLFGGDVMEMVSYPGGSWLMNDLSCGAGAGFRSPPAA